MELLRGGDIADDFARESDPMTPALRQVCSMKLVIFYEAMYYTIHHFRKMKKKLRLLYLLNLISFDVSR